MEPTLWTRYVAIGDSFTEGMVDPDPTGVSEYRGWADLLAARLQARADAAGQEFGYANLAVRGRKLHDVVGPQLERALDLAPDLVSMVGGGNDILRPSVDLDALAVTLEEAVIRIRATGADVLLATPTDPRDAGIFKPLRARHAIHTANLFTIAQRHGASVLNLWGLVSVRSWTMWGEDRIHLSTAGHAKVAQAALLALGLPTTDPDWNAPAPAASPVSRAEALSEHGRWVAVHATPWVQRRLRGTSSGDSITAKRPELSRIEQ